MKSLSMKVLPALLWLLLLSGAATSIDGSSHPTLTDVLRDYVQDGKVDYKGIRENRRSQLKSFVDSLSVAQPDTMSHKEQVAFWLDAYNGLVVHQVVETNSAPDSAKARAKFFRGRRYMVAGRSMTLDDIEHRALLPLAKDPRVHFVLVCGAQSCPPLQATSFVGLESLEESLEQATRSYLQDPRNIQIIAQERKLVLNKIFDWYADDFGDILAFVGRYRSESERKLLGEGKWTIEYRDYDWTLNESRSP